MKRQHSHPEHGRGRPAGIRLNPVRGDELWQWVKTNCEDGATLFDRGDLADLINAELTMAEIPSPPTVASLKSSLAGQFNGERTIPKSTIQGLALLCGVDADDLRKVLADGKAVIAKVPKQEGSPKPPRKDVDKKQDKKNVVIVSEIRERLLTGQPPSLLKCLESSETQLLRPKDKFGKHFFGVSTLLLVKLRGRKQPVILGYPRQSKDGLTEAREGWSILFHASFDLRIHGHPSKADDWVAVATEQPRRGREEFVGIPGGTLLHLIAYKVGICGEVKGTCRPLGVITRDLRADPEQRRVYTHYVFQTEISLPNVNTIKELESFAPGLKTQLGSPVSPSKDELDPEEFLLGKSRTIDYLAHCALRGEEKPEHDHTRFTRDFAIL